MKMQVSIFVLVILGLTSLTEGYNQRYKISSMEVYNNVTMMAIPQSNIDILKMDCPIVHYSSHWYKTLTMNTGDCSGGHYDGEQLVVKCYGKFEITDPNYGSFFFVLSSCGPMGLMDVLYDFSDEAPPVQVSSSTTTVVQLCPLVAMACALVATLF